MVFAISARMTQARLRQALREPIEGTRLAAHNIIKQHENKIHKSRSAPKVRQPRGAQAGPNDK